MRGDPRKWAYSSDRVQTARRHGALVEACRAAAYSVSSREQRVAHRRKRRIEFDRGD
jgi:hypothetical protein